MYLPLSRCIAPLKETPQMYAAKEKQGIVTNPSVLNRVCCDRLRSSYRRGLRAQENPRTVGSSGGTNSHNFDCKICNIWPFLLNFLTHGVGQDLGLTFLIS